MMHPAPTTAFSRTWTSCQTLASVPIWALGSTSAESTIMGFLLGWDWLRRQSPTPDVPRVSTARAALAPDAPPPPLAHAPPPPLACATASSRMRHRLLSRMHHRLRHSWCTEAGKSHLRVTRVPPCGRSGRSGRSGLCGGDGAGCAGGAAAPEPDAVWPPLALHAV